MSENITFTAQWDYRTAGGLHLGAETATHVLRVWAATTTGGYPWEVVTHDGVQVASGRADSRELAMKLAEAALA